MSFSALGTACDELVTDDIKKPNIIVIVSDDQGWGEVLVTLHILIAVPVVLDF